jgi:hypothetical protein
VLQVHPLSEVRQRLSGILAHFRREGAAAAPVAFGPHRKPEAVLLPYEVYERYEAIARQRARLDIALSAAQSVQVELPGPFTPDHDREVSAYVDGEISAAELYRRTVARYRRPVSADDPHTDPVTGVLLSKLGLAAAGELVSAEREITHAVLFGLGEQVARWFTTFALGEERELSKQLTSRSDKTFCDLNSLSSLIRCGRVAGHVRIFQLVAAAPEVCERPETISELSPSRPLNGIVTSTRGGAQALLRQERYARKPCGVICQDVSAVGIGADHHGGRRYRLACLREQRGAISLRAHHQLQFPASDELLHLSLASRPSTHRRAFLLLDARHRSRSPLTPGPRRAGQTGSAGGEGQPLAATPHPSGSLG